MTQIETEEVRTNAEVMKDIQNVAGVPRTDKQSETLFKYISDSWFFEYAMVAWKNRETDRFEEPKKNFNLGGPKSARTMKRMYMYLPNSRVAYDEFMEHIAPVWRDACDNEAERVRSPKIVDNR